MSVDPIPDEITKVYLPVPYRPGSIAFTYAVAAVTPVRVLGAAAAGVARYHPDFEERVGNIKLSVLYQRLQDDHGLQASWGTFYRYVRVHWPNRLADAPRVTVRLDDPPPGDEAQIDFCSTIIRTAGGDQ